LPFFNPLKFDNAVTLFYLNYWISFCLVYWGHSNA
jgi:hypothetical protein